MFERFNGYFIVNTQYDIRHFSLINLSTDYDHDHYHHHQ